MDFTWIIIGSLVVLVIVVAIIVVYRKRIEGDNDEAEAIAVTSAGPSSTSDHRTDDNDQYTFKEPTDPEPTEPTEPTNDGGDPAVAAVQHRVMTETIPLFRAFFTKVVSQLPGEYKKADLAIKKWTKRADEKYAVLLGGQSIVIVGGGFRTLALKESAFLVSGNPASVKIETLKDLSDFQNPDLPDTYFGLRFLTYEHVMGELLMKDLYDTDKIDQLTHLGRTPFKFEGRIPMLQALPMEYLISWTLAYIDGTYGGEYVFYPLRQRIVTKTQVDVSVLPISKVDMIARRVPWRIRFTFVFNKVSPIMYIPQFKAAGSITSGITALRTGIPLDNIRSSVMPYTADCVQRMNNLGIINRLPIEDPLYSLKYLYNYLKTKFGSTLTPLGYAWKNDYTVHFRFKYDDNTEYRSMKLIYGVRGALKILAMDSGKSGSLASRKTNLSVVDGNLKVLSTYTTLQALKKVEKGEGVSYRNFFAKYAGSNPNVYNTLIRPRYKPALDRIEGNFPMSYIWAVIGRRLEAGWNNQAKFVPTAYQWQGGDIVHVAYNIVKLNTNIPLADARAITLKKDSEGRVRVMRIGEPGTGILATMPESVPVTATELREIGDTSRDILPSVRV